MKWIGRAILLSVTSFTTSFASYAQNESSFVDERPVYGDEHTSFLSRSLGVFGATFGDVVGEEAFEDVEEAEEDGSELQGLGEANRLGLLVAAGGGGALLGTVEFSSTQNIVDQLQRTGVDGETLKQYLQARRALSAELARNHPFQRQLRAALHAKYRLDQLHRSTPVAVQPNQAWQLEGVIPQRRFDRAKAKLNGHLARMNDAVEDAVQRISYPFEESENAFGRRLRALHITKREGLTHQAVNDFSRFRITHRAHGGIAQELLPRFARQAAGWLSGLVLLFQFNRLIEEPDQLVSSRGGGEYVAPRNGAVQRIRTSALDWEE